MSTNGEMSKYPLFDKSKRGKSGRRRLGLSLKTSSDQDGVFAFKKDAIDHVKTNVQMGDSIIGVNNGVCTNMQDFISLLGYGEEKVELKILRNGNVIDGNIEFS